MKINFFVLRQITHAMWFLPAVFSVFALLVVVLAYFSSYVFPQSFNTSDLPITVSTNAVENILTIVASSMLAVTVFSLSTMVSIISTVSRTTSPRAVALVVADRTAQTAISIFIGAFLFSIVSIIGLSGEIYSTGGRLILFVATAIVVAAVVWALIRWIGHISVIGRVEETIERVEGATVKALGKHGRDGLFGCRPAESRPQFGAVLMCDTVGHVQHFDAGTLQGIAEECGLTVHILARPGDSVDHRTPLLGVCEAKGEKVLPRLRDGFTLGKQRTFDYDPRFGLTVLTEIGLKALSSSMQDPGTAVQVIEAQVRALIKWADSHRQQEEVRFDRLFLRPLPMAVMLVPSLSRMARESGRFREVDRALVQGLKSLDAIAPGKFGPQKIQRARIAASRP